MAVYKDKCPTKDGRAYYYKFNYSDVMDFPHTYKSKKFITKREAQDEEAETRLRLKTSTSSSISFGAVFQHYLSAKKETVKPQSWVKIKSYYYKYLSFLENVKVNDINYKHVEFLKSNLIGVPSYKNKILGQFACIIRFANKYYGTSLECLRFCDKIVDVNYVKPEMNFFTLDEFNRFCSVIHDPEWLLFFQFLFWFGLRKGELQALTWDCVDLKKSELHINRTLTTKLKGIEYSVSSPKTKNSIRALPIPSRLIESIKKYKCHEMEYSDFNDSWFVFGGTIPYKDTTIEVHKNNYCSASGVKKIRIHDFRHSCASMLINKGASIQLVSKYLGHGSIDITLRTYTHFYPSELENIKNVIDSLG